MSSSLYDVFKAELNSILSAESDLPDWKRFGLTRQIARACKKAPGNFIALRGKTTSDFLELNARCKEQKLLYSPQVRFRAQHIIRCVLENYTLKLGAAQQCSLDPYSLIDMWRFGGGSCVDITSTHFVDKVLGPIGATKAARPLVREMIDSTYTLKTFHSLGIEIAGENVDDIIPLVEHCYLTEVAKNEDTNRLICVMPLGNMALQLAAGTYISEAMALAGIDKSCQEPTNRLMACLGSMSGVYSTLDLKSASDTMSFALIEDLMPPEWFNFLCAIRLEKVNIDGAAGTKSGLRSLHMFAPMGCGFTWDLMSLVVAALCQAVMYDHAMPYNFTAFDKSLAVYGDDIIVPSDQALGVIAVLEGAGFIVNHDKSFFGAQPFRESCGGDYYLGVNITPIYMVTPARDTEVFVCLNQIYELCIRFDIELPQTRLHLLKRLKRKAVFVPPSFPPDSGVWTEDSELYQIVAAPKREAARLHAESKLSEYRSEVVFIRCLTPKPFRVAFSATHLLAISLVAEGYLSVCERTGELYYTPRPRIEQFARYVSGSRIYSRAFM